MDSANGHFKACFLGVGDNCQDIRKHVLSEFNDLIVSFRKYCDDDLAFSVDENNPQLTVLSFPEHQNNTVQDIIFLLGSQQDPLFWATRQKSISDAKYSFLFTLVLSENGAPGRSHTSSANEAIIFFDRRDKERQITSFVKDMCRSWIFPRLLSRDFSDMKQALSSTKGRYLCFESQPSEYLPGFRQFLSDNIDTIKRASDIFYIVSSNLGHDFSITQHLHPIIDEIEKSTNSECSIIGGDALYAENKSAFRVFMICSE